MTVVFVQNDSVSFYQAWQKNGVMLSLSKHLLKNSAVTLSGAEGSLEGERGLKEILHFVQNDSGCVQNDTTLSC